MLSVLTQSFRGFTHRAHDVSAIKKTKLRVCRRMKLKRFVFSYLASLLSFVRSDGYKIESCEKGFIRGHSLQSRLPNYGYYGVKI